MGIPIWCLIAPLFLVTVKAGLHDVVAQSFYETPQSSSPAPQSTRSKPTGMKEFVLFLTPEQVETLQAAGAVVQPYPEFENYYGDLQEQYRVNVAQQNDGIVWTNPIEYQKYNAQLQNYYKLLNIQEINDDLGQQTQATEGTTEMTTTTPRYKYTKARLQYKEKEFATPYVPKKSRTKTSNQSNNAEYVRFLPNYEHEILQMIPYQALPLSPYQYDNLYNQENVEAQRNAYSEANTEAQQNAFMPEDTEAHRNEYLTANTVTQPNIFSQANSVPKQSALIQIDPETQLNAYYEETTEAQQNAYSQANEIAQQNRLTQVITEAQRNVNSLENTHVSQQNTFTQGNTEAQLNEYSQKTAEVQRNAFSQAIAIAHQTATTKVNTEAQQNVHTSVNNATQQNTISHASIVPQQNEYFPANATAHQNPVIQVNTEIQQNGHTQANTLPQPNIFRQVIAEKQVNAYSQETTEGERNKYYQMNAEVLQNAFTSANAQAQQNTFPKEPAEVKQNSYSQESATTQNNAYSHRTTEGQQFTEVSTEAQQNAYSQANTVAQKTAFTVAFSEAQQNDFSQADTVTQRNAFSQLKTVTQQNTYSQPKTVVQETVKTVANIEVQQNGHSQARAEAQQNTYSQPKTVVPETVKTAVNKKAHQNGHSQAHTEVQPTVVQETVKTEANTKSQQNAYSRVNKGNQRYVTFRRPRPRIQLPKVTKKPQAVEKVPAPVVTQIPAKHKTYWISQDTKEFKETLSSIEGLPPLPPLELPLEKPATPTPPAPIVQTPIIRDHFSLLLAPLYQHQKITESISRQKEELLKSEFNILTKIQKMKESPEYYDQREYNAELEKLTRNFGQQNALAKIEATTVSNIPTVFVNHESERTESQPEELLKSTEFPMLVRIPKPHDVKIQAPSRVPVEFMQRRVPKPVVERKRPADPIRNAYIKVQNPYTMQKFTTFSEKQKIPVTIPISSDQLTIIRHIWEH